MQNVLSRALDRPRGNLQEELGQTKPFNSLGDEVGFGLQNTGHYPGVRLDLMLARGVVGGYTRTIHGYSRPLNEQKTLPPLRHLAAARQGPLKRRPIVRISTPRHHPSDLPPPCGSEMVRSSWPGLAMVPSIRHQAESICSVVRAPHGWRHPTLRHPM